MQKTKNGFQVLEIKMATLLMLGGSALINALAFSGTNYLFSHIDKNQAAKERQRHDEAIEQVQQANLTWSKQRTEKLDFYNKYLNDQGKSSQKIEDIVDAAHQYYLATGEKQTLTQKHILSDYYHPSDDQKTGEVIFIVGTLGILGFFTYKFL